MRLTTLLAVVVAAAVGVGSAVAAASPPSSSSRYPDVKVGTDCGCTGGTRARARLEMGLIPGTSTAGG